MTRMSNSAPRVASVSRNISLPMAWNARIANLDTLKIMDTVSAPRRGLQVLSMLSFTTFTS